MAAFCFQMLVAAFYALCIADNHFGTLPPLLGGIQYLLPDHDVAMGLGSLFVGLGFTYSTLVDPEPFATRSFRIITLFLVCVMLICSYPLFQLGNGLADFSDDHEWVGEVGWLLITVTYYVYAVVRYKRARESLSTT